MKKIIGWTLICPILMLTLCSVYKEVGFCKGIAVLLLAGIAVTLFLYGLSLILDDKP